MSAREPIYLKKVRITFPANGNAIGLLAERVSIYPNKLSNLKWHCTFYMVTAPAVLIQAFIDMYYKVKTIELLSEDGYRYLVDGVELVSIGVSHVASDMRIVENFIFELGDVTFVEKVEPHANPFSKKIEEAPGLQEAETPQAGQVLEGQVGEPAEGSPKEILVKPIPREQIAVPVEGSPGTYQCGRCGHVSDVGLFVGEFSCRSRTCGLWNYVPGSKAVQEQGIEKEECPEQP